MLTLPVPAMNPIRKGAYFMKGIIKIAALSLFLLGVCFGCRAQSAADSGRFVYSATYHNEIIPWAILPPVEIEAKAPRNLRKQVRKWNRLRNAVYVTYPYARIVAGTLKEVNAHLQQLPDEKEKKQYLKLKEEEMKVTFGPKIEDLSIYQGKVLIKLIYRETGEDCYNLIKGFKGGFSARFWQTVAFVFGSDLKTPYDKKKNADIESIVEEIQSNPFYYNAYYYQNRFN